jgi:hypothetical protein
MVFCRAVFACHASALAALGPATTAADVGVVDEAALFGLHRLEPDIAINLQANSLTASSLVQEIRERSGVSLNPSFLLSGLTPSQVADYVRREMADPQGGRAVRFQAVPSLEAELTHLGPTVENCVRSQPSELGQGCGVLVTGASGFLGSHVVRALLRALPDRKVFAVVRDQLSSSMPSCVIQLVGDIAEPCMVWKGSHCLCSAFSVCICVCACCMYVGT